MQLFIRDLGGQTFPLVVDPGADVASLKEQIANVRGVPLNEQCLTFAGRSLASSEQLDACGLTDESTIFLSLGLLGGAKKRKKKTYTKPKKLKHKRKKVKLLGGAKKRKKKTYTKPK